MRTDVLKQLLLAHVDGDDAAFKKAALQLVSAESTGDVSLGELRDLSEL